MTYVTPSDLSAYAGYDLDEVRARLLVEQVSAAADVVMGRSLDLTERTEVYDGPDGRTLMLRHWPVTAVATVVVTDTSGTDTTLDTDDYRWSAHGWLTRRGGSWPSHERSVAVTYTAGFQSGSADFDAVAGIVLGVVSDIASNPNRFDTLTTEGNSIRFGPGDFTRDQRATLRRYASRRVA